MGKLIDAEYENFKEDRLSSTIFSVHPSRFSLETAAAGIHDSPIKDVNKVRTKEDDVEEGEIVTHSPAGTEELSNHSFTHHDRIASDHTSVPSCQL